MTETLEREDAPPAADPPAAQEWQRDRNGREYAPARGRGGKVFRQGTETLEQAHERDAQVKRDPAPHSKKKSSVPRAPAPTQKTLQELEFMLTELLRSPEMITAATGDPWATDHFHREAPVLARNLTAAAEHNPWLRRKIEAALTGEELLIVKLLALIPVAAAAIAYTLPPIIYFLDPAFIPPSTRELFQVPQRPKKTEPEPEPQEGEDAGAALAEAPDGAVPVGA